MEFTMSSRMAYTGISYVSFLSRDSNEAFNVCFVIQIYTQSQFVHK